MRTSLCVPSTVAISTAPVAHRARSTPNARTIAVVQQHRKVPLLGSISGGTHGHKVVELVVYLYKCAIRQRGQARGTSRPCKGKQCPQRTLRARELHVNRSSAWLTAGPFLNPKSNPICGCRAKQQGRHDGPVAPTRKPAAAEEDHAPTFASSLACKGQELNRSGRRSDSNEAPARAPDLGVSETRYPLVPGRPHDALKCIADEALGPYRAVAPDIYRISEDRIRVAVLLYRRSEQAPESRFPNPSSRM